MGYEISKTGFADLPKGIINIDTDGYDIKQEHILSGRYVVKSAEELGLNQWEGGAKVVVFAGSVTRNQINRLDDLVLLLPGKARDSTGKRYDVRLTIKPEYYVSTDWVTPYLTVIRSAQNGGLLWLTSTENAYNQNYTTKQRCIGQSCEVIVDILDGEEPAHESVLFSAMDLDTYDSYSYNFLGNQELYGKDGEYLLPYQESVYPLGSIKSPVYMEPDTLIITNADQSGFGGSEGTASATAATVAWLVKTPIKFRHTISVGSTLLFSQITDYVMFTIISSAEEGGTISPKGAKEYDYKSSGTYVITPQYGYEIEDVLIDGVSAGPIDRYTFSNIMADHVIIAKFRNTIEPCEHDMEPMQFCGENRIFIPDC